MRIYGNATRRAAAIGLALAAGAAAAPAAAMSVCIRVAQYIETMPDGVTTVPMWGYRVAASCTAAQLANPTSAINQPVTSPGAAITVAPGDPTLTITLVNRPSANTALGETALPVPTSIVLHGHNTAMDPVFKGSATVNSPSTASDCTPGTTLDCRMRSFTREAAPGGTATYTYSNVRPGTYLYQSGTLPHIQVPMGLYGMLRKNAPQTTTAQRVAYPGAASAPDQYAFDNEIALLLSEVDPAQNGAVAAGTFTSSAIGYDPKFFRVHRYAMPTDPAVSVISQPVEFTDGPARGALSVTLGTRQLVRVVNAGIQSRALTLIDGHWHLIAEDGNVFPYPREQYSAFLPAAKSADLWFTPTLATGAALDRRMAIFDRRFALTNNDGNSVGGMLVRLNIAGTGTAPTLDVAGCPATGTQGTPYTCTAVATGSGAPLYSLDIAPVGMTIDAATGQIAWTPNNDQAYKPLLGQTASNPVQVRATDPSGRYATANFSVAVSNVDDAPVARDDAYDVRGGALTVGPARSVLVNDSDPDGDPITAVTLVAAPTNGTLTLNADGTFTYTAATLPTSGATTTTFTYKVTANGVDSAPATVTLTLYANSAPTAVDDVDARSFAAVGPSYLDVLANDYDVDGNLDVNTLAIVGAPNRGGTAAVATTGCPVATRPCIAYTPAPTFRGTEAITYRVSDTLGAASNVATARINVQ